MPLDYAILTRIYFAMSKSNRKRKKVTVICSILFVVLVTYCGAWIFKANPWDRYFHKKLNDPPRDFIVAQLNTIPIPRSGEIAIDLGSGVGHETYLLLQKGYSVIAIDNQKVAFDIMLKRPEIIPYKDYLKTYEVSFEKIDFHNIPEANIVIASFALPFCGPENYSQFWKKVSQQIKPGGYFIGNTFDPGFTAFTGNARKNMTFYTKAQTMKLFKDYKILYFKEVWKPATQNGLYDHYYEVAAKKIR